MPRKSSLSPELRALIEKSSKLKHQQQAEQALRRAARRELATAVMNAQKAVERARAALAAWDSRPFMPGCSITDIGRAHWSAETKASGRVELAERLAQWEFHLQSREVTLALFDEMSHAEAA